MMLTIHNVYLMHKVVHCDRIDTNMVGHYHAHIHSITTQQK